MPTYLLKRTLPIPYEITKVKDPKSGQSKRPAVISATVGPLLGL